MRSKGACSGRAAAAVSHNHPDVLDSGPGELLGGVGREIRPPLDAPHLIGEHSQQRGLKAAAGAYLEHALVPAEAQPLEHPRDQRRLRRDLLVQDR
jgi:hypothetical protein